MEVPSSPETTFRTYPWRHLLKETDICCSEKENRKKLCPIQNGSDPLAVKYLQFQPKGILEHPTHKQNWEIQNAPTFIYTLEVPALILSDPRPPYLSSLEISD